MYNKQDFLTEYGSTELQFQYLDKGFLHFWDQATRISCKGLLNLQEGFKATESLDNLTNLELLEIFAGKKSLDDYLKERHRSELMTACQERLNQLHRLDAVTDEIDEKDSVIADMDNQELEKFLKELEQIAEEMEDEERCNKCDKQSCDCEEEDHADSHKQLLL